MREAGKGIISLGILVLVVIIALKLILKTIGFIFHAGILLAVALILLGVFKKVSDKDA